MITLISGNSLSKMASLRAALCLNNMGVHLLEKGDFRASILTLVDAITLVKCIMADVRSSADGEFIITHHQQVLLRAYRRTSQIDSSRPLKNISIQAVSHDTQPSLVLPQGKTLGTEEATSKGSENSNKKHDFTLIRIDWIDGGTLTGQDIQPDLEASIMFYNLAVAYLVAAAIADGEGLADNVERKVEASRQLFVAASSLLSTGKLIISQWESRILLEILIKISQHKLSLLFFKSRARPSNDSTYFADLLESLSKDLGALVSSPTHAALAA